jgi:nudix-type nucleoside diphosphatase (YffH/AdpP family)
MEVKPSTEEVVSSTTIYSGRVLRYKMARVKLSDGSMHLREVVEHPGAVALIPIVGDQIVLIRQFRLPAGRVLYEIPAGTLEKGESPEECAARELIEETGYRAGKLTELFHCFLAPGYSTEMIRFYLATELESGMQHLDEDEAIQVCPTPIERALEMVHSNEIEDAKTTIGILLCEQYLATRKADDC